MWSLHLNSPFLQLVTWRSLYCSSWRFLILAVNAWERVPILKDAENCQNNSFYFYLQNTAAILAAPTAKKVSHYSINRQSSIFWLLNTFVLFLFANDSYFSSFYNKQKVSHYGINRQSLVKTLFKIQVNNLLLFCTDYPFTYFPMHLLKMQGLLV